MNKLSLLIGFILGAMVFFLGMTGIFLLGLFTLIGLLLKVFSVRYSQKINKLFGKIFN